MRKHWYPVWRGGFFGEEIKGLRTSKAEDLHRHGIKNLSRGILKSDLFVYNKCWSYSNNIYVVGTRRD